MLWFDDVSLVGFVLNPVIVPVASIVGCHGGILGILAAEVNGAMGSYILQLVSLMLDFVVSVVIWTAKFDWVVFKPNFFIRAVLIILVLALDLWLIRRLVLRYARLRGVVRYSVVR